MAVPKMADKFISVKEAIAYSAEKVALRAAISFMSARVLDKMIGALVRLCARHTLVEAAIRVCVHVLHDVALLLEALAAYRAGVAALVRVHEHVLRDALLVSKRFAAHSAFRRLLRYIHARQLGLCVPMPNHMR